MGCCGSRRKKPHKEKRVLVSNEIPDGDGLLILPERVSIYLY